MLGEFNCESGQESFFGENDEKRTLKMKKGEALHQITTGTSGYDKYLLCLARPSMGTFTYAQNNMHGWTSVHVDEHEFRAVTKAVDPETDEVVELYELVIENDDKPKPPSPPAEDAAEQFLSE